MPEQLQEEEARKDLDALFVKYVKECEEQDLPPSLQDFIYGYAFVKLYSIPFDKEGSVQLWC